MNKLLLTGADGFIGSHLAELLISNGYSVKALVQYNSFGTWGWLDSIDSKIVDQMEIVSGDVRDPYFCNNLVKDCITTILTKPTVIIAIKPTIKGLNPIALTSFRLVDKPTAAIAILKNILAESLMFNIELCQICCKFSVKNI